MEILLFGQIARLLWRELQLIENFMKTLWKMLIYGVLPEIIGKWYTRKHVADQDGVVRTLTAMEDSTRAEEENPQKP